jgi:ubiquinone/menaquinone biosynthesis C-methylase UbiE
LTASIERKVREHFDADAHRFDAIYAERKGLMSRLVDDVWRGVVRRRLLLTLDHLEPIQGKTILDVGCGSGRYCIAYAQRGAAHVLGVDISPAMISLAREQAVELGVADRCEFRVGSFLESVPGGSFDASTANGFFDYVAEPVKHISRMREVTTGTLVMSFPKAIEWRVPMRRLRFWINGCPLFLYTADKVQLILSEAGITNYEWITLDRDYLVVASV